MPTVEKNKSVAPAFVVEPKSVKDLIINVLAIMAVLVKHDIKVAKASDELSFSTNGYQVTPNMDGTIHIHNKLSDESAADVESPKDVLLWLKANPNKATKKLTPEEERAAVERGLAAKTVTPVASTPDDFGVNVEGLVPASKRLYNTIMDKLPKKFAEDLSIPKAKALIATVEITDDNAMYVPIKDACVKLRDTAETAEVTPEILHTFKEELFNAIKDSLEYKKESAPKFRRPHMMVAIIATLVYDKKKQTVAFSYMNEDETKVEFSGSVVEYKLRQVLALPAKYFTDFTTLLMKMVRGEVVYDPATEEGRRPEYLVMLPNCGFGEQKVLFDLKEALSKLDVIAPFVEFLFNRANLVCPWDIVNPADHPDIKVGTRLRVSWKDFGGFFDGDVISLSKGLRVRHDDSDVRFVLKHQSFEVIPNIPEDIKNWGKKENSEESEE